jgi:hypothetical protein
MLPLLRSHLWFLCFAADLLLQTALAWRAFTVPHIDDNSDDTPALQAVLNEYSTDSTILFEKGVYYNIFTPIIFPSLKNVEVRIEGNLSYPSDMATIQGAYTLHLVVRMNDLDSRSDCCFSCACFGYITAFLLTTGEQNFPGHW